MTPPPSSYGYLSPPVIDQAAKNNVKIDLNKAMYSSADTLETTRNRGNAIRFL